MLEGEVKRLQKKMKFSSDVNDCMAENSADFAVVVTAEKSPKNRIEDDGMSRDDDNEDDNNNSNNDNDNDNDNGNDNGNDNNDNNNNNNNNNNDNEGQLGFDLLRRLNEDDLSDCFEFSYEDLVAEIEEELRAENERFKVQELYEEEEKFLSQVGVEIEANEGGDPGILCPVCQSANLVNNSATNAIVCLGATCTVNIDWVAGDGMGVDDLRGNLAATFSDHGAGGCPGCLVFKVQDIFGMKNLGAECITCGFSEIVI